MNSKFTTFILVTITLLVIVCMSILGMNIYKDFVEAKKVEVGSFEYVPSEENIVENTNTSQSSSSIPTIDKIETTETKEETSYGKSDIKYFYSQLDATSKTIYDVILDNIENMETGTYTLEFGNRFSSILSQSNGQSILQDYYQSAVEAFLYDNPQIFYLDAEKMFLNIETRTKGNDVTYNVYINSGSESNYLEPEFSSKTQIEQCKSQVENVKNSILNNISGNDYQKILAIHDYLIDNTSYDTSISKSNIYNLYGALINKECVCEGYAKAFKYLTSEAGLDCVMIVGSATDSNGQSESHAWNYIKLNNIWYAIDVTWDDPVIIGGGTLSDELRYKYLLKGLNTMQQDHFPRGNFTENGKLFTYPTLSNTDY